MLAIASSYSMCGFLNRAVPLHTVTVAINSFISNNIGIIFIKIIKL